MKVAAVILAGGQARRMGGGDKPLMAYRGRPMLDQVIERIAPQVAALALSANGDPARFGAYSLPVLPDPLPGFPGPLAGVLAGMDWAVRLGLTHVLSVPGDTPLLPADLVRRLSVHDFAMAQSLGRRHPVVALWPVNLRDALRDALMAGERKVGWFARQHGAVAVDFPVAGDGSGQDPFFNVNTPEDLHQAHDA